MEKNRVVSLPEIKSEDVDSKLVEWQLMPESYKKFVERNEVSVLGAIKSYILYGVYFEDHFLSLSVSREKEREILKKKNLPSGEAREVEVDFGGENMKIDAGEVVIGQ